MSLWVVSLVSLIRKCKPHLQTQHLVRWFPICFIFHLLFLFIPGAHFRIFLLYLLIAIFYFVVIGQQGLFTFNIYCFFLSAMINLLHFLIRSTLAVNGLNSVSSTCSVFHFYIVATYLNMFRFISSGLSYVTCNYNLQETHAVTLIVTQLKLHNTTVYSSLYIGPLWIMNRLLRYHMISFPPFNLRLTVILISSYYKGLSGHFSHKLRHLVR